MITRLLPVLAIAALHATASAGTPTVIELGDGKIDGSTIEPYELTWKQCAKHEEDWIDTGTLTETVTEIAIDGKPLLRLEQLGRRPDGVRSEAVTFFDRETLAPLRIEAKVYDPDGNEVRATFYELGPNGYTGHKTTKGNRESVSGDVTSQMYHGMTLGLALATLDPKEAFPVELSASMISFDGEYRVIATMAGRENLMVKGESVEAWMVDVEWHHLGVGDVYPPGPDASGGRYWIIPNPPDGMPYVPRYKTDTYAVEFVPGVCS